MIKSLSSLRFVFAIMVFLVHIHKTNLAIGHAFFIVLSGFILAMVYEKRIKEKTFSFGSFFLKRILRTYPLHILTLLMALPLSLQGIRSETLLWVSKFFLNLFSLQVFVPHRQFYFSFNGVAWNLSDLMIFYACFPFIILLLSKLTFREFTFLMIGIALLICLSMNLVPEELYHYLFYISPFFRIFDFIFGIYLFYLTKNISYKPDYKTASFIELFSSTICVVMYIFADSNYSDIIPYSYSVLLWLPLALILLGFHFDKGIISKYILAAPFMLTLGKLSFSFYMIHQLVIRYFKKYGTSLEITENTGFMLCFLVSLALAYLSNTYFERLFYKK